MRKARRRPGSGCDAGDPLSCYALGALLETDGKPADEAKALELYEKACTGGAADGCSELGMVYFSGRTSKGGDPDKAASYLEKACSLGDRSSCLQVGIVKGCIANPASDDPACRAMKRK